MEYFLVSYIKIKGGKEQMYTAVERMESLKELYAFHMRMNRVVLYAEKITGNLANIDFNAELTAKMEA